MTFEQLKARLNLAKNEPEANWHQHTNILPNGNRKEGGWVENTAKVAPTAYIGINAIVGQNADIRDNARIDDRAVVCGRGIVADEGRVIGCGVVYEDVVIADRGIVGGNAVARGNSKVIEDAMIFGQAQFMTTCACQARQEYAVMSLLKGRYRSVETWC